MQHRRPLGFSPYRIFTRQEWARLRADTLMTISQQDLDHLSGLIEELSMEEVEQVYLPLSRLLNLYVQAAQELHTISQRFLGKQDVKVPFVLGVAGSVAVGKSTTARVLRALLARWPDHPRVGLVTTDSFLYPNSELEKRGIMHRKGFPESFNTVQLLRFLVEIKSGSPLVEAPLYSHFYYNVLQDEVQQLEKLDILIVEGLNVLQPARLPKNGDAIPYVSDFFDFSIYIDADVDLCERWYITRFLRLRETAFQDPKAYFHRYAKLSNTEAIACAREIWRSINLRNLMENILPTRSRAQLILKKGTDHRVESISLRKV